MARSSSFGTKRSFIVGEAKGDTGVRDRLRRRLDLERELEVCQAQFSTVQIGDTALIAECPSTEPSDPSVQSFSKMGQVPDDSKTSDDFVNDDAQVLAQPCVSSSVGHLLGGLQCRILPHSQLDDASDAGLVPVTNQPKSSAVIGCLGDGLTNEEQE